MISANGWRGSGASFAKIAAGLIARGHRALLVTVAPRLTARFAAEGLPVLELPLHDTGLVEAWRLGRALAEFGATAAMADTPRDLRLLALATLPRRTPIVYRFNRAPSRAVRLADRFFARRVAAVVFLSTIQEQEALAAVPWFSRVERFRIPNGFDTARFAPDPAGGQRFRQRFGIAADATVVMTPGKPARGKGQETVLAALARLADGGGPAPVCVVLGDGVMQAELRALAARLGVSTVFTGFLAPEVVAGALNAADLIVHPSRRETFGNAFVEAMACARPVIATAVGAAPEAIGTDGAAGVLVAPGDVPALADAIGALLADPERRAAMGVAARERVRRDFPLERMADGYEHMFARVTGCG